MTTADENEATCRAVVLGFCRAMNDWERIQTILNRVATNQFVLESQRASVSGITEEAHRLSHVSIFDDFIVSKKRKYGSNPGEAISWSPQGSFHGVSPESISSVEFPTAKRGKVVANWSYLLPGAQTMFVLKRIEKGWLIDSLKTGKAGAWDKSYL